MPNKNMFRFILVLIPVLLSGCASKPENKYEAVEAQEEEQQANPRELYERTAALFSRPENLGLDFYSPTYYASALEALEDAEAALNNTQQAGVSPIRASIAARKLLEKAQQNRASVNRNLKALVQHRNLLLELEANKWQPADWKNVEKEIKELIILIEEDQTKAAITKEPGVRQDMYDLEVQTLLRSALTPARDTLKQAKENQAEVYAPKYYNSADILIDDTAIYIKGNFRDRKGIARQAELARLEALRALKTAKDGKIIFDLSESESEAYFKSLIEQINAIALEFGEERLPPLTIKEALQQVLDLAKQHQISTINEPEPEPEVDEYQAMDNEVQVLEVLESLDLKDYDDTQNGNEEVFDATPVEEQQFDSIEFVE